MDDELDRCEWLRKRQGEKKRENGNCKEVGIMKADGDENGSSKFCQEMNAVTSLEFKYFF